MRRKEIRIKTCSVKKKKKVNKQSNNDKGEFGGNKNKYRWKKKMNIETHNVNEKKKMSKVK